MLGAAPVARHIQERVRRLAREEEQLEELGTAVPRQTSMFSLFLERKRNTQFFIVNYSKNKISKFPFLFLSVHFLLRLAVDLYYSILSIKGVKVSALA